MTKTINGKICYEAQVKELVEGDLVYIKNSVDLGRFKFLYRKGMDYWFEYLDRDKGRKGFLFSSAYVYKIPKIAKIRKVQKQK